MHPDDDTTCCIMPVHNAQGKKTYYPLQRGLENLAKKANFHTFGAFECCRDLLSGNRLTEYVPFVAEWMAPLTQQVAREGNFDIVHAVP